MTEQLLDLIKKEYAAASGAAPMAPGMEYYAHLAMLRDWWRGKYAPFHEHRESCAGAPPVRRELYRMGMAKTVCEDWATVLINDRTRLYIEDAALSAHLLGTRECMGGHLTGGSFWSRLNAFVEESFALGMGGVFTGTVLGESGAHLPLHFVSAEWIVPLASSDGEITACAFLGAGGIATTAKGGKGKGRRARAYDTETEATAVLFFPKENGYITRYLAISKKGDVRVRHEAETAYKPFATSSPNIVSPDASRAVFGGGVSVFEGAIDNLKGIDLAYNNFCRDLYLGGKKVFLNQSLTQSDAYGNRVAPDDVAQQLFLTVGDTDLSSDTMLFEHNPDLRAEENARAVQAQLDYLSFKVGFGARRYCSSDPRVVTATQYAGEKQAFLQHAMKHYIRVEAFLRALVDMAAEGEVDGVSVDFDDSFFIDPTAERERDLREVQLGLLLPWEYRVKYYGESAAEAKAALGQ